MSFHGGLSERVSIDGLRTGLRIGRWRTGGAERGRPGPFRTSRYHHGAAYNQRLRSGIHVFPALTIQVTDTRYRVQDTTVTTRKVRGGILHEPPSFAPRFSRRKIGRVGSRRKSTIIFPSEWGTSGSSILAKQKGWSYTREGKRESSEVLTTSDPHLTLSLKEIFDELSESIGE